MDSKIKELERLVAADPSNHDAIARLYHFQKRMGSEDSFAQKIESAKDIYESIHVYFGTEEGHCYFPIKNETETSWFIHQGGDDEPFIDKRLVRIYNPIVEDFDYFDDYYNDHGGAAPIPMLRYFRDVFVSIYGARITDIYEVKENKEYSLIYSHLKRARNRSGPVYRLFKNSNKIDIVEYWEKYQKYSKGIENG